MANMCLLPQGQNLSQKPLCLAAEDPAKKFVCVCSLKNVALSLCCPYHMEVGLGSIQGEAKKGPRLHDLFLKDSFFSKLWRFHFF